MHIRNGFQAITITLLALLPSTCISQSYQGPSGGRGGKPFDHWATSNGAKDIAGVSFLQDSTIRCIYVLYRDLPAASSQLKNGYCDPPPGPLSFNGSKGISLDPDEYIIGIAGRFGDHIDSIRIYTNKKNSPVFGGNGGTDDFGYTAPHGQMIVGFLGRAGDNLDAIGVLYAPCTPVKTGCT